MNCDMVLKNSLAVVTGGAGADAIKFLAGPVATAVSGVGNITILNGAGIEERTRPPKEGLYR